MNQAEQAFRQIARKEYKRLWEKTKRQSQRLVELKELVFSLQRSFKADNKVEANALLSRMIKLLAQCSLEKEE